MPAFPGNVAVKTSCFPVYFHHQYQLGFHETRISSPLSGVVKPSFLAYSSPVDVGLVLECGFIRACRGANGSAFSNRKGKRGGMGMKRKSNSCPAAALGKAGSRKTQPAGEPAWPGTGLSGTLTLLGGCGPPCWSRALPAPRTLLLLRG